MNAPRPVDSRRELPSKLPQSASAPKAPPKIHTISIPFFGGGKPRATRIAERERVDFAKLDRAVADSAQALRADAQFRRLIDHCLASLKNGEGEEVKIGMEELDNHAALIISDALRRQKFRSVRVWAMCAADLPRIRILFRVRTRVLDARRYLEIPA